MPRNSTGTIAVWRNATNVATFDLSPQDTGVRVRQVQAPNTTVNLPGQAPNNGDSYEIVDADGSASVLNQLVIAAPAGTTIRGGATFAIASPFGSALVTFDADADDWIVQQSGAGGAGATPAHGYSRFFGGNPVPAATLTPLLTVIVTPRTSGIFQLLAMGSVTDSSGLSNQADFQFTDGAATWVGTSVTAAANAKAGFAQVVDTDAFTGPYPVGVPVTFTLNVFPEHAADAGNSMFAVQELDA